MSGAWAPSPPPHLKTRPPIAAPRGATRRRRPDLRAVRAADRRPRGGGCRGLLPAPGDLPPDLPLAAAAAGGRPAAAQRRRDRPGGAAGPGELLRVRRDVRAEER